MARAKGNLSNSEPKNHIIKFILKNNEPVEESKIREELKKKNKKTNQGNVNRYLHELRKESACIELETIKKGQRKYNLWNVTKIEQLKNILHNFPEMQLNEYEKSVNIVLKKFDFAIGSMRAKKAFVQLSLSVSFFNKFMDTDIETLYTRALKFDQLDECFSLEKDIERSIEIHTHEAYPECIKRIQKIPGIWPIADDEYIENSVNLDIHQNSPHSFQNNIISEEEFKRILKEITFSLEEKDRHEQTKRIIKELSKKLSHEISSKRLKNLSKEPMQSQEAFNKMSDEILKRLLEESPEDLPDKIYIIISNQHRNTGLIFDKIFYHFYQRDIIDGSDSDEEHKFVSEMNVLTSLNLTMKLYPWKKVEELDNLYNDYYEKCRKKMGIIK